MLPPEIGMGKPVPIEVHEENVGILRNELPIFVANFRHCRIESLLVNEFRRILAQGRRIHLLSRSATSRLRQGQRSPSRPTRAQYYLPHRLPLPAPGLFPMFTDARVFLFPQGFAVAPITSIRW